MARQNESQTRVKTCHGKISEAFAHRLNQLQPNEEIRAIVLPDSKKNAPSNGLRQDRKARQAAIARAKEFAQQAYEDIDQKLAPVHGHRLTDRPNALGFVQVETTVEGIEAITELDWVGAVVEDQPLHLLHKQLANTREKPAQVRQTLLRLAHS